MTGEVNDTLIMFLSLFSDRFNSICMIINIYDFFFNITKFTRRIPLKSLFLIYEMNCNFNL